MRGVVVKVFSDKGFAFLRGFDGIQRFFHASWVTRKMFDTLHEGTEVEFDPIMGDRGPQAHNVTAIPRVVNAGD